jgi:hypothetical protein
MNGFVARAVIESHQPCLDTTMVGAVFAAGNWTPVFISRGLSVASSYP